MAWQNKGKYAVGGEVFDIGITTSHALSNYQNGEPPEMSGPRHENSNGNGSLMRILPLVLWHQGSDEDLVRDAMVQSLVTHGHLRSQVCCALYCLWARELLNDQNDGFAVATQKLRAILRDSPAMEELEFHLRPDLFNAGNGSGYVVDSLRSARWLMREKTFENVVKAAVELGNDTDTTACIAGGVAGIREGVEAIPSRWRENLRGQEIAAPLLERLLQQRLG